MEKEQDQALASAMTVYKQARDAYAKLAIQYEVRIGSLKTYPVLNLLNSLSSCSADNQVILDQWAAQWQPDEDMAEHIRFVLNEEGFGELTI